MESIQILGIVVLVVGIILIGVEFYMPGFGVPGVLGIICSVAGVLLTGKNAAERITVALITIAVIAVMLLISIIAFNSKKVRSPIKLDTDLSFLVVSELLGSFQLELSDFRIVAHRQEADIDFRYTYLYFTYVY